MVLIICQQGTKCNVTVIHRNKNQIDLIRFYTSGESKKTAYLQDLEESTVLLS